MIRGLLLSAALVGATVSTAFAADVVVEEPAAFNWSGVYVGIQGGYGGGNSEIDTTGAPPSPDIDGGFIGGVVSALYQADQFVIGAEAEYSAANIDGEEVGGLPIDQALDNVFTNEVNSFGSVALKGGVAFDRLLVFGTAGVGFADIETAQDVGAINNGFSDSQGFVGFTVGAGVDFALTDNLIAGINYRYYDFGDKDFNDLDNGFDDRNVDVDLHTVSASLSYKF